MKMMLISRSGYCQTSGNSKNSGKMLLPDIAKTREKCYCQTSGNSKNSGKMLLPDVCIAINSENILLPDVTKFCSAVHEILAFTDGLTDGQTDGRKTERLYRTLLKQVRQ